LTRYNALSASGWGLNLGPRVNELQRKRGQRSLCRTVTVTGISALVCAVCTLAIAADDQFVFSDDRFSVKVKVRDMPLGEVLRRLLDNTHADIQWRDPALEKEPTTGSFKGPIADVVRHVPRDTNFMLAFSGQGTVACVIVLGRPGQTAAVAPGVGLVPAGNSPSPLATPPPQQTAQPAAAAPSVARPTAPAHVPNPPRRSHDM